MIHTHTHTLIAEREGVREFLKCRHLLEKVNFFLCFPFFADNFEVKGPAFFCSKELIIDI